MPVQCPLIVNDMPLLLISLPVNKDIRKNKINIARLDGILVVARPVHILVNQRLKTLYVSPRKAFIQQRLKRPAVAERKGKPLTGILPDLPARIDGNFRALIAA